MLSDDSTLLQLRASLPTLSLPIRVLFTGYLVVTGVGLMMAGLQVLLTHGMADGEFGLSVNDIVYSYHGNRENSKLEEKLSGSMKDKADTHERAEIVKWVRDGSKREEWDSHIQAIFQENCISCHGVVPGIPDFRTFEGTKPSAQISEGATIGALARVSHVHLFGISFIFFFVCLIFSFSVGISPIIKSIAIGTPFVFLLVDIASWWLTKWYPSFAYMQITGGVCMNISAAFMILVSLFQMWILPYRK